MDHQFFLLAFKRAGDMREMGKNFFFPDSQYLGKIADAQGIAFKKGDNLATDGLRHSILWHLGYF